MRRFSLLALAALLAACSRGSSPTAASAASAHLAGALAQSGVQCQPHQPPSVQACDGKTSGAACQVSGEDGTRTGTCKTIADGRLVCAGAHEDGGEAQDGDQDGGPGEVDQGDGEHGDHDGGVDEDHDGGHHDAADGGHHHDGGGGDFDHDGGHHDAADGGDSQDGEQDGGDDLPRPAVDACAGLAASAACSFTFEEHSFSGACEKSPAGTLVCAPICGN